MNGLLFHVLFFFTISLFFGRTNKNIVFKYFFLIETNFYVTPPTQINTHFPMVPKKFSFIKENLILLKGNGNSIWRAGRSQLLKEKGNFKFSGRSSRLNKRGILIFPPGRVVGGIGMFSKYGKKMMVGESTVRSNFLRLPAN